jgi:hypothetical protein
MSECPVCSAMEPETIDRLLTLGYGPQFISTRWGSPATTSSDIGMNVWWGREGCTWKRTYSGWQ